jgi:hypothetical protein
MEHIQQQVTPLRHACRISHKGPPALFFLGMHLSITVFVQWQ